MLYLLTNNPFKEKRILLRKQIFSTMVVIDLVLGINHKKNFRFFVTLCKMQEKRVTKIASETHLIVCEDAEYIIIHPTYSVILSSRSQVLNQGSPRSPWRGSWRFVGVSKVKF